MLAPDLGDVAGQGVAEARAEQSATIQALDRHRERTPAGRATGADRLMEAAESDVHGITLSPINRCRPLAATRARPNDR
jgi:hypothetical protein